MRSLLLVLSAAAFAAPVRAASEWAPFAPASLGLMTSLQSVARRTDSCPALAELDARKPEDRLAAGALAAQLPPDFVARLAQVMDDPRGSAAQLPGLAADLAGAERRSRPLVEETVAARVRELAQAFADGKLDHEELARASADLASFRHFSPAAAAGAKSAERLALQAKAKARAEELAAELDAPQPDEESTSPVRYGLVDVSRLDRLVAEHVASLVRKIDAAQTSVAVDETMLETFPAVRAAAARARARGVKIK